MTNWQPRCHKIFPTIRNMDKRALFCCCFPIYHFQTPWKTYKPLAAFPGLMLVQGRSMIPQPLAKGKNFSFLYPTCQFVTGKNEYVFGSNRLINKTSNDKSNILGTARNYLFLCLFLPSFQSQKHLHRIYKFPQEDVQDLLQDDVSQLLCFDTN